MHLAAMSVWLGGLVTLIVFLLRRHRSAGARRDPAGLVALGRPGRGLAGGRRRGAGGGAGRLGRPRSGRTTTAGCCPPRWRSWRAHSAPPPTPAGSVQRAPGAGDGAGRLRRTVGIEVAATAVILGLSAVLVQVNPARSAAVDQGAVREHGVSQTLTCPLFTLQFNIFPVRGRRQQHGPRVRLHAERRAAAGPGVDGQRPAARPGGIEPVSHAAAAARAAAPRGRRHHVPAAPATTRSGSRCGSATSTRPRCRRRSAVAGTTTR